MSHRRTPRETPCHWDPCSRRGAEDAAQGTSRRRSAHDETLPRMRQARRPSNARVGLPPRQGRSARRCRSPAARSRR
eukprot:5837020-Pleurochrysis_carterae.AAC.1